MSLLQATRAAIGECHIIVGRDTISASGAALRGGDN